MTTIDQQSEAIIKAVEDNLAGLFGKGAVARVDTESEASVLFAKAAATTDPSLAAAYRAMAYELEDGDE